MNRGWSQTDVMGLGSGSGLHETCSVQNEDVFLVVLYCSSEHARYQCVCVCTIPPHVARLRARVCACVYILFLPFLKLCCVEMNTLLQGGLLQTGSTCLKATPTSFLTNNHAAVSACDGMVSLAHTLLIPHCKTTPLCRARLADPLYFQTVC